MSERGETTVVAALREALSGPTRLARLFGDEGASVPETNLSSIGKPPGLTSHCSRQISGAQVDAQGDACYATAPLP